MKKDKKAILQRLSNNFSNIDSGVQDVFKSVDQELADVAIKLKKSVELKTVAEANDQFKKLEKLFKAIPPSFEELKRGIQERDKKLLSSIQEKNQLLVQMIEEARTQSNQLSGAESSKRADEINSLQADINSLREDLAQSPDVRKLLSISENKIYALIGSLEESIVTKADFTKTATDLGNGVTSLRTELERLSRLGGGSAPRQINVSSSVMSTRFADINFVSNTAIKWTASDDTTNKRVNITASLISGGAGGGGTPGGANQQVQFNDNGAFGGSSTLTWDKDASVLAVQNRATVRSPNTVGNATAVLQLITPDHSNAYRMLSLKEETSGADWNLWMGTQAIPNLYIGGSGGTNNSFWQGNWNTASVAGNTFKSASNDATQVPLEIVGQATQSAHYLDVTKVTQGDVFTIDGTGKVGINTTSAPDGLLDIHGAIGNIYTSYFNAIYGRLQTDAQNDSNGKRWRIFTDNSTPDIELTTSGGNIRINPAGNTGINNPSPQARLDIGTTSSIAGTLRMQGSTAGYVQLQPASVAGNWTFTLPVGSGANAQYLMTDGNGITQWASVVATGGSGISRSTSIITANTTGGSTGSTDYVYIATNSLNFTLPNPVGNGNLYTVKNATSSSVVVTALAGKTIDGSGSVVSAINNQSLDFISDGNVYRII